MVSTRDDRHARKLLIEKGVITDAEFKQNLLEERAVYQCILNSTRSNRSGETNTATCLDASSLSRGTDGGILGSPFLLLY